VENLGGKREVLAVEEMKFLAPVPEGSGKFLWLPVELRLEVWSR
jgi:hypothetical protein